MKTIFKTFALILIVTFASCMKHNDLEQEKFKISTALSIVVNNGKVGVTTLVNENYSIYTDYWIDGVKSDNTQMTELLPAGSYFRTSIDANYRVSTVYRNTSGDVVRYKFPRNYDLNPDHQLYYYKNTELHQMDTTTLGAIHAVDAAQDEVFAGFFGRGEYSPQYGYYLSPTKAFYREGTNKPQILPMPANYFYFEGVTCVHKSANTVYVGGKMDFPMYWKNTEVVRLNDNYGVVNQIQTVGDDVYAVGFYNKKNSNSTNHTACYWKNNTLIELEDGAVAYSIFFDGNDVYVSGAKGRFEAEYQACYWKNGERVMLETVDNPE